MSIPPVGRNNDGNQVYGARPTSPAKLFAVSTPAEDQLPDLPPADVLDALDTAARVLHELDRNKVSIRLEHDTSTNQIRAHVGEAGGTEHEVSQGALLNVLAGDTSSLKPS
jgi:hypothetical protein